MTSSCKVGVIRRTFQVSVKWWCVLLLLALPILVGAQLFGQQSQTPAPPFWLTNEVNDGTRRTPSNPFIKPDRNNNNNNNNNEDNYMFQRDNVRHFYHLNLVQGQQVYSNNSGHM